MNDVRCLRAKEGMMTLLEPSNEYEHQTNGAAEVMNHQVERQACTMLAALEERLEREMATPIWP